MTQNKIRLDAMLSSTSKDLPDHREAAAHGVHRAGFYAIKMEDLGARAGEDALSVSLAMVDEAEVYVGIFGQRYGFRPKDPTRNPDDLSVTELEYRRAVELGMPILIFMMHEDHPAPDISGLKAADAKKRMDDFFEPDPIGQSKLAAFKETLMNNNIVGFFKSAEELKDLVFHALMQDDLKAKARAYHAKRAAESTPDGTPPRPDSRMIAPPALYAVPAYSGNAVRFVGRADELQMLDSWWDKADAPALFVLEAIGGMGKSALAWKWMQDRATHFDGMFWYSFYEGGADMLDCLRHAHAYFTRTPFAESRNLTRAVLLNQLLPVLKQKRHLLILDGMERILVAYHRWDAAQMQDDSVQGDREHRACIEPQDEDTLRQLLDCAPSRVLVTSRLMPDALQEYNQPLPAVRHHLLGGLSHEDAKRLWRDLPITWDDEALLDRFLTEIGGHSLLLKLVGGEITKSRRAKFDEWYLLQDKHVNFAALDLKAKQHHILESAYRGLTDEARRVLSLIAAFGEPVDIDTLDVFNPYMPPRPQEVEKPDTGYLERLQRRLASAETDEDRQRWQQSIAYEEAELAPKQAAYDAYQQALAAYPKPNSREVIQARRHMDILLSELEARGLLWWDRDAGRYDLHPVVRGYAFDQLDDAERSTTYGRVVNFFEAQERTFDNDQARTLQDLQPIISLYKALLGAGKRDEAARLYGRRLENPLYYHVANYQKAYELLLPLFGDGLSQPPTLTDEDQRRYRTTSMANILSALNRDEDALTLDAVYVQLELAREDAEDLCLSLSNYGISLLGLNRLHESEQIFLASQRVATETASNERLAVAHLRLQSLYVTLGRWDEADAAYQAYLENPRQMKNAFWLSVVKRDYARSLFDRGADARQALDEAERACRDARAIRAWREVIFTQGELALAERRTDEALERFNAVIKSANESGTRIDEYWGGLARGYLARGDTRNATRIVRDFCDNYSAAVVLHAIGEADEARARALKSYEYAWADGEPYVRRYDLERARALLVMLGVPEPALAVKPRVAHPFIAEVESWLIRWHEKRKK